MQIDKYINEIKAFLYGIAIYLQIDTDIVYILITLIFTDMLLGAIKSVSVPEMEFKTSAFWVGLLKKALLLIVIMVLALIARGLGFKDFKEMVSMVIKIMILNEGISIINSIRSIKDKKEHKSNDFISILIEKIGQYLTKKMDLFIKFFDNNSTCL